MIYPVDEWTKKAPITGMIVSSDYCAKNPGVKRDHKLSHSNNNVKSYPVTPDTPSF